MAAESKKLERRKEVWAVSVYRFRPNRNLLVRKLDPPQTWNTMGIAIFGREPSVSHNSKSYIKLGWVRRIRDAEPLDTEESIRRYVRYQIFCLLGSTLFTELMHSTRFVVIWPHRCPSSNANTQCLSPMASHHLAYASPDSSNLF
ncbi:hypothetical protein Ahy_A09g042882 [Arachis hypogaea]|uniref:Uncharacterized protein n=1 Tax=Arachis hypogaea TaxID=3818 RepID=A0A445BH18_ARAHY|nr:hypothetical protein Ahy_A09g042882 [Arachis hypogaea]